MDNYNKITPDTLILHVCEVCGKEETITAEEGYNMGWDYPPTIGAFRTVSPRTCGNCGIDKTLWAELMFNKTPIDELSPRHKQTLLRILAEPNNILR